MLLAKSINSPGTTVVQTINKTMGRINFAASDASKVVNNSLVDSSSIIFCTVVTADATMKSVSVQAGSGTFTITANAAPAGEVAVNWIVFN